MSCQICFNNYDHSIHKPYMLSFPHTFYIQCTNKFDKCPVCFETIFVKNPNLALLDYIKNSNYDNLKESLVKNLNKINDVKNAIIHKRDVKLNEYSYKLTSIRKQLIAEAKKLIELVNERERHLNYEISEIELGLAENLSSFKEFDYVARLVKLRTCVENNSFSEEELSNLVGESNAIMTQINDLVIKVENFTDNTEYDS